MADSDRTNALTRPVPPTTGRVGIRGFLALGAVVGAAGWGATVLLTARPDAVAAPEWTAVGAWAVLVAVMGGVGVFGTPDAVRFSRPMLAWSVANGSASVASVLGVLGVLPDRAHLVAWSLAGATGYLATGLLVGRPDARVYRVAAVLEGVLFVGVLGGLDGTTALGLLGVCHALPLALVAATDDRRAPLVLVGGFLAVVAMGTVA